MDWQINANGMSAAAVARSLNARGIKGKRGGTWQSGGVTRSIENEFHDERMKFPLPTNWGNKIWHRK